MSKPLIVMACSGAKLGHAAEAKDLYQGVLWQSLRAHANPDNMPHIVALSALHGFVSGSTVIEPYDKLLTGPRARELQYDLGRFVRLVDWPQGVTRMLLAGGGLYRHLMRAMIGELQNAGALGKHLQVSEISGGIGAQRSQMGKFIRNPESLPSPIVGYHPNGTPLFAQAWGLKVGDRVRTTGAHVGKAGPELARIEELFDGPRGPTACIEMEAVRPPRADGKPLSEQRSRSRWIAAAELARVVPGDRTGENVPKLESVWAPIPGLKLLAAVAELEGRIGMDSMIAGELAEPEAPAPRMH